MASSPLQAPILLEDYHLLVNDTVYSVRYLPKFPTDTLPPFSNLNTKAMLSFVHHHEIFKSYINFTFRFRTWRVSQLDETHEVT